MPSCDVGAGMNPCHQVRDCWRACAIAALQTRASALKSQPWETCAYQTLEVWSVCRRSFASSRAEMSFHNYENSAGGCVLTLCSLEAGRRLRVFFLASKTNGALVNFTEHTSVLALPQIFAAHIAIDFDWLADGRTTDVHYPLDSR